MKSAAKEAYDRRKKELAGTLALVKDRCAIRPFGMRP